MAQADCPFGCLADGCERFRQNLFQRLLLSLELLFFIQAFDVAKELSNAILEFVCLAA